MFRIDRRSTVFRFSMHLRSPITWSAISWSFRSNWWTGFSLCTADLQSLPLGPHSAVTAQITLASDARTYFVSAGSASVSLPPQLCTWLPGLRSSARVTHQCTSTTALFDYISAGRSAHCAFYHWRPHFSSDCCISLEQSALSLIHIWRCRRRG